MKGIPQFTTCKRITGALLAGMLATSVILTACGNESAGTKASAINTEELLLYLNFDEGSGNQANDASGHLEAAEVNYNFTNAAYTENMDPQWRSSGIEGGSLLFDGNSTCITYANKDLAVSGSDFSISVWVAPRAFEWDDPNAQSTGEEQLTSIVAQYNKDKKQGFILGYERYGRLCFEIGAGDKWYTLWGDSDSGYLEKDAWNYVTAVFDGTNGEISLYLNGTQVAHDTLEAGSEITPTTKAKLYVGKNDQATAIAAGTYCMFSGLMDELKLYNIALTEEQAQVTLDTVPEIAYDEIALENVLTEDIYKTQYHGGPYEHWMNEPHSPVYYNGTYHLFFQQNMVGTYWRNIQWGHLVSDDLVNWTPVKEAICATKDTIVPDGVWSGNAAYDVNGVPLLFFTAGNDSYTNSGLISNQNIGVAYPADLSDPELTDWVIYDQLAVTQEVGQGRAGEFRDPYIWEHDGSWYMLICSGSYTEAGGAALLYKTDTLELKADGTIDMDWQYVNSIYEMENQSMTYGTSWELPILLHMTSEDGSQEKDYLFISPAPASLADNKVYYFAGTFDYETGTFTPDEEYANSPALLDYGDNVFTGPSVLTDPVSGEYYMFSIMQDKRTGAEEGAAGWAHCVGLTRRLWLDNDGTLCMEPISNLQDQQGEVLVDASDLTLEEANEQLSTVSGDLLYVKAVLDISGSSTNEFGITVKADANGKGSVYSYNVEKSTISGTAADKGKEGLAGAFSGPLALDDKTLTMEIYIDRSLVEAFFNQEKSISLRSYSDFDNQALSLFADDTLTVKELYVAEMKSIY